jgi:hypothetical protein
MKEAIDAIRKLAAKIYGGMESYEADAVSQQIQAECDKLQAIADMRAKTNPR